MHFFPGTLNSYRWNTTAITVLNASQLTSTSGIYLDSKDDLYIADEQANHVVWRLANNTSTAVRIAGLLLSSGPNSSQLRNPQDVYFDSSGNLYVSDLNNFRIQKYINGSMLGVTIAGTGFSGSTLSQLNSGRYFSFDTTETYVFVADSDNHRIMRFTTSSTNGTNGTVVAGGNGAGLGNTQLYSPWGIHYVPTVSNYMYISNNVIHTVVKWIPGASSGVLVAGSPNISGSSSTLLDGPMGVKIDAYENLYVVDRNNHRIQMFCENNATGITIAGTGTGGNSATQLSSLRGMAFDSSMNLYVSDFGNRRIQKFLKL